ncbi:MAG: hypothetical protein US76_02735 [Parcubacteria group bacterium GW2011_GWA2_38_13b]|nr:MAG: hypothetical protein US76_02735 [Parcubacteria group bacterium GW2011_GWA2_38_13b]
MNNFEIFIYPDNINREAHSFHPKISDRGFIVNKKHPSVFRQGISGGKSFDFLAVAGDNFSIYNSIIYAQRHHLFIAVFVWQIHPYKPEIVGLCYLSFFIVIFA